MPARKTAIDTVIDLFTTRPIEEAEQLLSIATATVKARRKGVGVAKTERRASRPRPATPGSAAHPAGDVLNVSD